MKLSIILFGTVSAKTGSGSIISDKRNNLATTNGLRGQDKQQHQNRKIQALNGDGDFEEALADLFGDIPDVEDLSQDPEAGSDTAQGFDINELVEDLLDSHGDSAFSGGLLGDLLGEGNVGDSTTSGLLDFLGMDMYACSDKCKEEDKGVCDSFMMSMDPTTVFEDACNTGCIPQVRLDTCAQFCSDTNAATADDVDTAAVTAVAQKRGMFDSLVQDLMCSDCKFYICCAGDGGTYDMCKDELTTDINDQATGDSILSDLLEDLSGSLGGSIMEDVDIDNIFEDLPDLSSLFPSDADSSGLILLLIGIFKSCWIKCWRHLDWKTCLVVCKISLMKRQLPILKRLLILSLVILTRVLLRDYVLGILISRASSQMICASKTRSFLAVMDWIHFVRNARVENVME